MNKTTIIASALAALLAGHAAQAAVSAEEAAKLKSTLTPLGAEKAANKDGSIPAWSGGITKPLPGKKLGVIPTQIFTDEKPLYQVNAKNAAQYADLGYALDADMQGQGLMPEAVQAVIAFAFGPLNLHRIRACYLPTNERSGAALRRLGFVVEGYARDYLLIDGRWQDQILTGLINPDWQPA